MEVFIAWVTGTLMGFMICVWLVQSYQPNITEVEFLRFCMDKKIERKDCLIPAPIRKRGK